MNEEEGEYYTSDYTMNGIHDQFGGYRIVCKLSFSIKKDKVDPKKIETYMNIIQKDMLNIIRTKCGLPTEEVIRIAPRSSL